MDKYPRDMQGYGQHPPNPNWPNKARIALQFVVNYEEGGENNVLDGDPHSETFLSEIIGAKAYSDRHMSMESLYEYGSRAGFWRIYRLFQQHAIPVTAFAVSKAMQRNPEVVRAMLDAQWEIATHGMRWIDYQTMPIEQECQMMQDTIELHQQLTGKKPAGWYTGRTSPNTLNLVSQRNDIVYCADSYADDLPYYDTQYQKPILMVPYTLDTNDMRFATQQGFNTAEHFYTYLKDAFDVLYQEGATQPKMLSIGLHCRLIGRPARMAGLKRFIEYIQQFDHVWCCTREQIARHWLEHFPYDGA